MLDKAAVQELLALVERSAVCSEAAELLDLCLADQSPTRLEEFIEHKVLTNDASLNVLQDLAESVHQHMIALQESLFDLRLTTLRSLYERFNVDLVQLLPAALIEEYHLLELDEAIGFVAARYPELDETDLVVVCHTLHNSVNRATEITNSIALVRQMLDYIFDWAEALSISAFQSYWTVFETHPTRIRIH